jgi:amino acid permease
MIFGIYLMVYAAWRMRSIHVALAKRRQILKRMSFFVGVFIITLCKPSFSLICSINRVNPLNHVPIVPEAIHIVWTMFRVAVVGITHPDVESPLEELAAYGIVACGIGNLLVC